jgi:hypothetical protein
MFRAFWTCDRCGIRDTAQRDDDPHPRPANWRMLELPHRKGGWAEDQTICPACVASLEQWMRS